MESAPSSHVARIAWALLIAWQALSACAAEAPPAWEKAHLQKPMTADETKAFMKKLAQFVVDNHMRKDPNSPVRGMVYEYLDTTRKGQFDQFVQGEALDTMHDGAWFAAAMVNAYRATGDPFYKGILAKWQLPFYLKMLNHSDELFSASSLPKAIHESLREGTAQTSLPKVSHLREGMPRDRPAPESAEYPPEGVKPSGGSASPRRDDSRPTAHKWGKEWLFQEGEKGFVPYFWDDGGSVSLERRQDKNPLGVYQCVDLLAGKPNPNFLLNGHSLGSSNHMAQDLGVMLELAWLLFRESPDEADEKVTAEIAQAAKNLYECRMRHHGPIPVCVAPWALASSNADLMKRGVPDPEDKALWTPKNHYTRALYDFEPGKPCPLPGFADDQEYQYYHGIARAGGTLPKPLAFKLIYDAYTHPMLFRYYCDDWEVPPGINVFDLYPYQMKDGRPTDYRSGRKGPHNTPKPIGSRFGPQNMVVCGWALQALNAYPGIWEERYQQQFSQDARVYVVESYPGAKNESLSPQPIDVGGEKLGLFSRRLVLQLHGMTTREQLAIRLFSRPEAKGSHSAVRALAKGDVSAVNDLDQPLAITGSVKEMGLGHWLFTLSLPYTAARGQKPWANGIEHGRYSIQVGDQTRDFYLASREHTVRDWLEHQLGGGLRTWEAIFNEKGYIPTGMGTSYDWDKFSDTGGYAHLISAAAQWLLVLEGKRDWEIHRVPQILKNQTAGRGNDE